MKRVILILPAMIFFSIQFNACFAQKVDASFMVFSDPHYYDSSLGTEGEAFEHYLNHDRKLLRESRELIIEATKMIISKKPDFIIVPGDLTKDGTLISHLEFAQLMHKIEAKRIKVFIIPGNHDISNGESNAFREDKKELVDNVSPEKFTKIYEELGFSEAIYRDENSLSYIAEPVEGIWLFGLDPCLYKENIAGHHPVTDGEYSKETLQWIEEKALEGKEKGKIMIAAMHQGILEHYKGQDKFFGEYVVNNYKKVSKMLASSGINFVFTGHYHAQDITMKQWKDDKFIYDIETGSLVTFPCPLREVHLTNNEMVIHSEFIKSIPSMPNGFSEFSRTYAHEGIAGIAEQVMMSMFLKQEDAAKLSSQIADAFITHYQGDEPPKEKYLDLKGVGLLGRIMILFKKGVIKGLCNDLPPKDNELIIDVKTGSWK